MLPIFSRLTRQTYLGATLISTTHISIPQKYDRYGPKHGLGSNKSVLEMDTKHILVVKKPPWWFLVPKAGAVLRLGGSLLGGYGEAPPL